MSCAMREGKERDGDGRGGGREERGWERGGIGDGRGGGREERDRGWERGEGMGERRGDRREERGRDRGWEIGGGGYSLHQLYKLH